MSSPAPTLSGTHDFLRKALAQFSIKSRSHLAELRLGRFGRVAGLRLWRFAFRRKRRPSLLILDLLRMLLAPVWFSILVLVWLATAILFALGRSSLRALALTRWATQPRHALGVLLMLALLASSTPAAPQTI